MKVRALKTYYDLVLKKTIEEGQEIEVTEERAAELSNNENKAGMKLVEKVMMENEEPDSNAETEKKAQSKRRKKAEKVETEEEQETAEEQETEEEQEDEEDV